MAKINSFQTKRGFLKRALLQPGPHYHFCNWLYLEYINLFEPINPKILDKAINYSIWLIKNKFKNKLYIHSDWYFNSAIIMACRRNSKYKKYLKYIRTDIGIDARQFQTLEPVTSKEIQLKSPKDFFKN